MSPHLEALRAQIARRKLVVLVGAGVSMAASGNAEVASWRGLLENGIAWCEREVPGLDPLWGEIARLELKTGQFLSVAEKVTEQLGGRKGGEYESWLTETVGKLPLTDPELIDALQVLELPMATTNYDNLLTRTRAGWEAVTWEDRASIVSALQGDDQAVVHLHGYWRRPESVVLGVRSYTEVMGHESTQNIMRGLLTFGSLLMVGVGAGLDDPNFGALRTWMRQALDDAPNDHYRLFCEMERKDVEAEHANDPRIKLISYGSDYSALGPFLRSLRETPVAATRVPDPPSPLPPGRPDGRARAPTPARGELFDVPALGSDYVDRPREIARVREFVTDNPIVGITGAPGPDNRPRKGVGKRVLATAIAHDPAIRAAFPDGIHWLEMGSHDIRSAQDTLARQMGLPEPEEIPGAPSRRTEQIREALSARACLLILDDARRGDDVVAVGLVGPTGRILCTTDHRNVLDHLEAKIVELDVLSANDAKRLLLASAGMKVGPRCLRADVSRIIKATGHVPLALAMVGAVLATGERTCAGVAGELEEGGGLDVLGAEYAESHRATRAAVAALTSVDADRYLDLVVFPDHELIPLTALRLLWGVDSLDDVREFVGRLEASKLIEKEQTAASDGPNAETVEAVRIRRALLLLEIEARANRARTSGGGGESPRQRIMRLHGKLVDAYRSRCRTPGVWAALPPDEPYIWDHLIHHVDGRADEEELRAIARDVGFLTAHAHVSGPRAVERDLARAARTLDDDIVRWLHRFLATSGHLLANQPNLVALATSLRLMLLDAPECDLDIDPLEAFLPPLHLVPLWREPPLLGSLIRVACPDEWAAINVVAFTADGRLVAGDSRGRIRAWDAEFAAAPAESDPHDEQVTALAICGNSMVIGRGDGSIGLWNPSAPERIRPLTGLGDSVHSLACADGQRLVSCGDRRIHVTRVGDPRAEPINLGPLDGPAGALAVALSPNGELLAAAGEDAIVRVWNVTAEPRPLPSFSGHESSVRSLAFSRDGRDLASGDEDGVIRVWSAREPGEPLELAGHDLAITCLAFASDGRLASSGEDGRVTLWSVRGTRKPIVVAHDANSAVNTVAVSADGERLAAGDSDGRIRIWDIATTESQHAIGSEMAGIGAMAMSPDGRILATASDDGIAIRNAGNGNQIATAGADGTIALLAAGGLAPAPPGSRNAGVAALTFSGDSRWLAWGGAGRTAGAAIGGVQKSAMVFVWDRTDAGRIPVALPTRSPAQAIAVSATGRWLAAACSDRCLRVWDLDSGEGPSELMPAIAAEAIVFSPDGLSVVAGAMDGRLLSWRLDDAAEGVALVPPGRRITALASCSATGAVAYGAGTEIWLLGAEGGLTEVPGHSARVNALAFSNDGRLLASGAEDASAHLVELASGNLLLQADAGVRGLGLAWAGDRNDRSGSRMALQIDNAVLMAEMRHRQ